MTSIIIVGTVALFVSHFPRLAVALVALLAVVLLSR